MDGFVEAYNDQRHHHGSGFHTLAHAHFGLTVEIAQIRQC